MKPDSLIIELPHLQSLRQRLGSWVVAIGCWVLWIYFLIPLVSLSGWLMGVRKFSAEVRWFGGYKSLIELLQMYGLTILAILVAWLLWTALTSLIRRLPGRSGHLDAEGNESRLVVSPVNLAAARSQKAMTVTFNESGQITAIIASGADQNPGS